MPPGGPRPALPLGQHVSRASPASRAGGSGPGTPPPASCGWQRAADTCGLRWDRLLYPGIIQWLLASVARL
eukprot:5438794-Prorocentrum_lima.AAC.1